MSSAQHPTDPAPYDNPSAVPPANAPAPPKHRGSSGRWFAIVLALLLGVAFAVFVIQNSTSTRVTFLGWHGNLPLSLAMLIAAIVGILITAAVSTGRSAARRRRNR